MVAIAFVLALLTSLAMWVGIITLFFMNPVLFLWIVFLVRGDRRGADPHA
jgi:hypothetical protein